MDEFYTDDSEEVNIDKLNKEIVKNYLMIENLILKTKII